MIFRKWYTTLFRNCHLTSWHGKLFQYFPKGKPISKYLGLFNFKSIGVKRAVAIRYVKFGDKKSANLQQQIQITSCFPAEIGTGRWKLVDDVFQWLHDWMSVRKKILFCNLLSTTAEVCEALIWIPYSQIEKNSYIFVFKTRNSNNIQDKIRPIQCESIF